MSEMKLSEAIRLGAMQLPEVRGPVFDYVDWEQPCAACAVGAALFAIGHRNGVDFARKMYEAWPWTENEVKLTPDSIASPVPLLIVGLFENRGWTRERIADWIETIEPQTTPATSREEARTEQETAATAVSYAQK